MCSNDASGLKDHNTSAKISSSIFARLSEGTGDLKFVSNPASKLQYLVQAIQVNHEKYELNEHQQQQQAAPQVWHIASLTHSLLRGRDSLGLVDNYNKVVGRSRSASSDEQPTPEKPFKGDKTGQDFPLHLQRNILRVSKGPRVIAFRVKFSRDLLHGELDSTDDNPSAVLARFETVARRQIMQAFTQSSDINVVGVTYDVKNDALYFALDSIGEEATLSKCSKYVKDAISSGSFWIEYPESNLNFCPSQEAVLTIIKRQ